jgi:hypothetical protein
MADAGGAVSRLVCLGFSREDVVSALARTDADEDEAVLLLTGEQLAPPKPLQKKTRGRRQPPAGGDPSWDCLPQDVLTVLGKWLAVYLGDPPPRADGSGVPEYLHPVTRARDAQKLGKQRLAATRCKLKAVRACRQTCRTWRAEISYATVRHLALDGHFVSARESYIRPGDAGAEQRREYWDAAAASACSGDGDSSSSSFNNISAAIAAISAAFAPSTSGAQAGGAASFIHTWWPGHRTLPRGGHGRAADTVRCPACEGPVAALLPMNWSMRRPTAAQRTKIGFRTKGLLWTCTEAQQLREWYGEYRGCALPPASIIACTHATAAALLPPWDR